MLTFTDFCACWIEKDENVESTRAATLPCNRIMCAMHRDVSSNRFELSRTKIQRTSSFATQNKDKKWIQA